MNRKAMIESICDYVLSQDHEREDLIGNMIYWMTHENYNKKFCLEAAVNYPYYKAYCLLYGKRQAMKEIRQCYKEALE
jgi:hypothetical protein